MKTINLKFTAILLIMAGLCSCTPADRLEKELEKEPEEPVTVPLTEYSLEGTGCQWTNLGYDNTVVIINSREDLEKYITCTEGGFPEVDFSEHTLLLAYGTSTYGVQEIHPELLSTGNEYVLKIEITQNDATVVESWHIALVTDKIAEKAGVELTVKIAGLQGTKWIEAIVVDLGSPAVDGCGWAINIDNITYIPDNLDEQYKQNRLKVMIVYENTSQIYQCPGFSEINYDKIIIKQIMKIET